MKDSGAARGELATRSIDSLMVGINGQIAGLIDFRASSRLRAATALQELRNRSRQPLAIGLVSDRHHPQIHHHAAALGVDFEYGGLSTADLTQLIRGCQRRGLKVAYAGECLKRSRPPARPMWPSRWTTTDWKSLERNPASILLLQPDLSRLAVLREVSRVHRKQVLSAEGGAFLPNFFCVAGALFLGFSSLTTVMITNLGTGSTYARTASRIRRLKQRLARSSGRRGATIIG